MKRAVLYVSTIAMLCFATVASGAPDTNDIDRIKGVWVVVYISNDGGETIASVRTPDGGWAPMIAINAARLESMLTAAREIAKVRDVKFKLVRFGSREDLEDITK